MTKLHSLLIEINLIFRADFTRTKSDVRNLRDHWTEHNLSQHFLAWTASLHFSGFCLLSFVIHTERYLPIQLPFKLMTIFKHLILKGPSSIIAFQSAPFISCPFEQSSANTAASKGISEAIFLMVLNGEPLKNNTSVLLCDVLSKESSIKTDSGMLYA